MQEETKNQTEHTKKKEKKKITQHAHLKWMKLLTWIITTFTDRFDFNCEQYLNEEKKKTKRLQ